MSVSLSINLSICLSLYVSLCLSTYLSIYLSIYLSTIIYIYPSNYRSHTVTYKHAHTFVHNILLQSIQSDQDTIVFRIYKLTTLIYLCADIVLWMSASQVTIAASAINIQPMPVWADITATATRCYNMNGWLAGPTAWQQQHPYWIIKPLMCSK